MKIGLICFEVSLKTFNFFVSFCQSANDPELAANISVLGEEELCFNQRLWWIFMGSSAITFYTGLAAILLVRLLVFLSCRKEPEKNSKDSRDEKQKTNPQAKKKEKNQYQAVLSSKTLVSKLYFYL